MTPRKTQLPDRKRARSRQRALSAELEQMTARLEATERRLGRLQNTVNAVAREAGVSMDGPCGHCGRSHLIVADGTLRCPSCGYRRSL
ncbi:hypothetical protein EL22_27035 [Halostagnicola sp. A56]|uniref:hypothetical protein n=1 Tax=Halostagnicola sp. A56 TaxID=1495067 RepID=UPI00065F6B59|nr:hypothetical protein [Halostagnicola sp. A56]KMT45833.1 hypothetical protein EL22_27035 [Halostagnicola sp. A56]